MGKVPLKNATEQSGGPPTTPASAAAPPPSAASCDGAESGKTSDGGEPEITAAVTPWSAVGLSEDLWNDLEIPPFLRRTEATLTAPSTPTSTVSPPKAATAPAAGVSGGYTSGVNTPAPNPAGLTGGMFDQFRVDPEEIEAKIKREADALWRNWIPTKEDRKRPRLSTYIKRVRKTYYP